MRGTKLRLNWHLSAFEHALQNSLIQSIDQQDTKKRNKFRCKIDFMLIHAYAIIKVHEKKLCENCTYKFGLAPSVVAGSQHCET